MKKQKVPLAAIEQLYSRYRELLDDSSVDITYQKASSSLAKIRERMAKEVYAMSAGKDGSMSDHKAVSTKGKVSQLVALAGSAFGSHKKGVTSSSHKNAATKKNPMSELQHRTKKAVTLAKQLLMESPQSSCSSASKVGQEVLVPTSQVGHDIMVASSDDDVDVEDAICPKCGSTPCEWYVYVDDELLAKIEEYLSGEYNDLAPKKKCYRLYCAFSEKKHGKTKKRTIPDCCYSRINSIFPDESSSNDERDLGAVNDF